MHWDVVAVGNAANDIGVCSTSIDNTATQLALPSADTRYLFGLCSHGAEYPLESTPGSLYMGSSQRLNSVDGLDRIRLDVDTSSSLQIQGLGSKNSLANSYIGVTAVDSGGALTEDFFRWYRTYTNVCTAVNLASRYGNTATVTGYTFASPYDKVNNSTALFDLPDTVQGDRADGVYNQIGTGAIMVLELAVTDAGTATQRLVRTDQKFYNKTVSTSNPLRNEQTPIVTMYPRASVRCSNTYGVVLGDKNRLAEILINPTDETAWDNMCFTHSATQALASHATPDSGESEIALNRDGAALALPNKITIRNPLTGHRMRIFNMMYMQVE